MGHDPVRLPILADQRTARVSLKANTQHAGKYQYQHQINITVIQRLLIRIMSQKCTNIARSDPSLRAVKVVRSTKLDVSERNVDLHEDRRLWFAACVSPAGDDAGLWQKIPRMARKSDGLHMVVDVCFGAQLEEQGEKKERS